MSATEVQHPSGSAHTGTPWSWVGVAAVMVLISRCCRSGWLATSGETTRPGGGETAPVTEIQIEVPAKDLVLHGRGLVDMPDQVAVAKGAAAATKSTANETSGAGAGIAAKATCPEQLALKLFC